MDYFDAKQYVKLEFMIDWMKDWGERKAKVLSDYERELIVNEGRELLQDQDHESDQ